MSVWFKYAGDKDITTGHPGGSSLFTLPVTGGGGFPPAGSFNSLIEDIEYPVANGGGTISVVHPDSLIGYSTPSETCDVTIRNDGSGGTYEDWANVTDVKAKAYGVFAYEFNDVINYITITGNCTGSSNYQNGTCTVTFYHDGSYGSYSATTAYSYAPYYTTFFSEECMDENSNTYTTIYLSDGNGGYFT